MNENTAQTIDLIISASYILPVVPHDTVYQDCSIAIDKGVILGIFPSDEIDQRYHASEHRQLDNHVVMPGLINAHGHSAMSLLRGFADDLPLMTWLENHIWPAEAKFVDETFVKDGANLAIAEMLLSGTTCFSDMYFYPEMTAQAAAQAGMRAQIYFPILDFPTAWAQDADEYISKGLALHDDYRSSDLITVGFGPHAPYTVSDAPLKRIATLSDEMQAPIHIHLHETEFEVTQSLSDHGQRPIQRLQELGVMTPLTQCVHMTQVSDVDIKILQETGSSVIHCPESNLKLASGACPVQALTDADVTVALGTDGAASNNDLDMFGEVQTAALLAKHTAKDASAVDAHAALRMATINGAKAMNQAHIVGSLEPQKQADMIAIDLSSLPAMPCHNVASLLVYTNLSHAVQHVWVKGKCLVQNRELNTIKSSLLRERVLHWQKTLAR